MTLVLQHRADVNALSGAHITSVLVACSWANDEVVRFPIENGADVNRPDKYNRMCIMFAVSSVNIAAV